MDTGNAERMMQGTHNLLTVIETQTLSWPIGKVNAQMQRLQDALTRPLLLEEVRRLLAMVI